MFERIIRDNLLAIAGAYAEATGKSLTEVSKEFYGRGNFLVQLRQGRHSLSVPKLGAMLRKFRQKWPRDTKWPPYRAVLMGRREQR